MKRRIQLTVTMLAILLSTAMANSGAPGGNGAGGGFRAELSLPERILHFPPDRSIGEIALIDATYVVPEVSREFHPGYVFAPSQYLGSARGDVHIPAGKCVCLHLGGKGVTRQQCLAALKSLGPNDVQDLDFLAPTQADDGYLPSIAKLTGITHFCPVRARFTGKGWTTLQGLAHLTHICTPYGLTDAEMAGIATLPTVNEMEIVATKLTDAGLASIGRMRNLEVLHLAGTPVMTDEGLKALTTLPKLRHLRLSGPFTDQGWAYLTALPSVKVLWLETPKTAEDGLQHLARMGSLERLCLPYLDRISDRGLSYLKSMPKLMALGVGDADSADAGVAILASLPNLEVLALKGSSALTDGALKPLTSMPKLRALEIYNSRITERGLTSLTACKKLDSVQIKSSVPVSQEAVARLRTELPSLQTVDISRAEPPVTARLASPAHAAMMR